MELKDIFEQYKNGTISLQEVQMAIQNSPEMRAQLAQQQAAKERGEKVAVANDVLDLLKNVGFTAFALNQIGSANRMDNTVPSLPPVPGLNPQLSEAIYQAQRGTSAMPSLEASRQGIEDAYTGSLNRAEAASGGQAGAYQAMSQLANIERLKAQLGLAPIAQGIQADNNQNLNQLLGMRGDERQQDYLNRLYGSQIQFDHYNNAAQAIGGLGATGRTNLLDAADRTVGSIQSLTPYYAGFSPEHQKFIDNARAENISNFSNTSNYTGIWDPNYSMKRPNTGTV